MVQAPGFKTISNPVLVELIERLISFYDPDQIYIFGSRARGDFHEDSDYDLVVVVPNTTPKEDLGSSYKLRHGLDIFADVKVYTRTGFDKQLHLKASMPSTILREGILLYARTGAPPPEALYKPPTIREPWRVCEGEPPASDPVRLDSCFDWILQARSDVRTAEWLLSQARGADLGLSLFHSQQAVEKALKAFLVWCDQPARRHHDLDLLGRDCWQLDQTLEPSLRSINWLTVWSIAGRYPLHEQQQPIPPPTTDLARNGLLAATLVYEAIVGRLPQEIIDRLEQA